MHFDKRTEVEDTPNHGKWQFKIQSKYKPTAGSNQPAIV